MRSGTRWMLSMSSVTKSGSRRRSLTLQIPTNLEDQGGPSGTGAILDGHASGIATIGRIAVVTIYVLVAVAAGFVGGWIVRTLRPASSGGTPRRIVPYDRDEYLRRVDRLDRAYTDSIKEYDRLVT